MGDRKTITIPENLHRDLNEQRESLEMTWPEFLKHLDRGETDIGEAVVEVTVEEEELVEEFLRQAGEDGAFTVNVEAEDIAAELVGEMENGPDADEVASRVSEQVTADVRSTVEATIEEAVGRGY